MARPQLRLHVGGEPVHGRGVLGGVGAAGETEGKQTSATAPEYMYFKYFRVEMKKLCDMLVSKKYMTSYRSWLLFDRHMLNLFYLFLGNRTQKTNILGSPKGQMVQVQGDIGTTTYRTYVHSIKLKFGKVFLIGPAQKTSFFSPT